MSKLISIEGCDGTGKTTQSIALVKNLKKHNKEAILVREPGGTKIGEILRNLLKYEKNIEPFSELLLFQAARTELVEKVILPALKSDKIIVIDRYRDSTIAYQGFGRGLNIDLINLLNKVSTKNLKPDLTILLDMPVKEAISRTKSREKETQTLDKNDAKNFEKESFEFHSKVSDGFKTLAKNSKNWVTINGALKIDQISKLIWKEVNNIL